MKKLNEMTDEQKASRAKLKHKGKIIVSTIRVHEPNKKPVTTYVLDDDSVVTIEK